MPLIATLTPEISPPPPAGTKTVVTFGRCSRISRPTVPWPAMTHGSSNGGTIVSPRRAHSSSALALRCERRRPSDDHFGAIPPHTVDLDRRRRLGHDDHGGNAESLRDQRDRLTMIAGGIGDDAGGARLGRQLRNHVAGTAHLERAHRLQVFALERQRTDLEERRSSAPLRGSAPRPPSRRRA